MTRFHTARIVSLAALAAATSYTITDLGSLGFGVSDALAINNNGQVTGYSYTSQQIQVSCPPHQYGGQKKCFIHPYHAFLWSNGAMKDLGTSAAPTARATPSTCPGRWSARRTPRPAAPRSCGTARR